MTAFQPEPIGDAERFETLTRLREARDAGTLAPEDYLERARSAVSTDSRDELARLTVGIDTPTFETYPHQGVSPVQDRPIAPGYTPAPSPYGSYPEPTPGHAAFTPPARPTRPRNAMSGLIGVVAALLVVAVIGRTGMWWLIFFIPVLAGILRRTFKA